MRKIFISSRLKGNIQSNTETAKELARQAIELGYIPIMPHLYFTQFLSEETQDRATGIVAGLFLMKDCDQFVIYDDDGISDGMAIEIAYWKATKYTEPVLWNTFKSRHFLTPQTVATK
jgi:hypothetical protein